MKACRLQMMVVKGGGPEADRARKKLVNIFNNEGLQITNECNVSVVNFLDVVLDLNNGASRPYVKPNGSTKYVCATSSHPPSVIRSIPAGVSKRLSTISTDKDMSKKLDTTKKLLRKLDTKISLNSWRKTVQQEATTTEIRGKQEK